MKESITIDDISLGTKINNNQTLTFTKKKFFYTILGVIQSPSGPLNDIEDVIQLIPGKYKSKKPIQFTGVDKVHSKRDSINGSIINGVQESILYSFALSSPPGCQTYKELRIKLFKNLNKPVLSLILFYLVDDDHKPVDFKGETISFNWQLIEI